MKITIFNGSIHAERGNTQVVADAFAEGARGAGAEVESVFLSKKLIRPCTACTLCWTKTPGACVQKDDMAELLEKFMASDIVAIATPVYVDTMTAITKLFLDRLVPVIDPHFEKHESGEVRHLKRYDKYPLFVIISTCGFPGQVQFRGLSEYFKRVAFHTHSRVIAEIYRDGGIMLKMPEGSPLQSMAENYKKLVEKAGGEIARDGAISEPVQKQLAQPFVPEEIYIAEANKFWDKKIAKAQKATGA